MDEVRAKIEKSMAWIRERLDNEDQFPQWLLNHWLSRYTAYESVLTWMDEAKVYDPELDNDPMHMEDYYNGDNPSHITWKMP